MIFFAKFWIFWAEIGQKRKIVDLQALNEITSFLWAQQRTDSSEDEAGRSGKQDEATLRLKKQETITVEKQRQIKVEKK